MLFNYFINTTKKTGIGCTLGHGNSHVDCGIVITLVVLKLKRRSVVPVGRLISRVRTPAVSFAVVPGHSLSMVVFYTGSATYLVHIVKYLCRRGLVKSTKLVAVLIAVVLEAVHLLISPLLLILMAVESLLIDQGLRDLAPIHRREIPILITPLAVATLSLYATIPEELSSYLGEYTYRLLGYR